MKTVKLTYRTTGTYATQKTVSATVAKNSNAFSQFEESVYTRFGDVTINHVAKTVSFN